MNLKPQKINKLIPEFIDYLSNFKKKQENKIWNYKIE